MPDNQVIILKPELGKEDIAEEQAWVYGLHSVLAVCSSVHGDNGQPVHRCDTIDIHPAEGCELNVSMSDSRVFIVARKKKDGKAWRETVDGVHEKESK